MEEVNFSGERNEDFITIPIRKEWFTAFRRGMQLPLKRP